MHALHVMQGSSHNLWVIGKDLKLTRTGLLCTLKDENECNESLSENWKSFSSSVSPPCGGSKFVFVLRVSDSRYCGGLNWIGGGIISWPINKSKSNSEKKLWLFTSHSPLVCLPIRFFGLMVSKPCINDFDVLSRSFPKRILFDFILS